MEKDNAKTKEPKLTLKRRAWLKAYLKTFNATEAARVAGYRCKNPDSFETIGYQNFRKLQPVIQRWFEQVGLTPERIKAKIIQGMEARETKRVKVKGAVKQESLPAGRHLIATSGTLAYDKEGKEVFGDGNSVIEWEEEALGIQQKYVDLGCRVLLLYDGDLVERVAKLERALAVVRENE